MSLREVPCITCNYNMEYYTRSNGILEHCGAKCLILRKRRAVYLENSGWICWHRKCGPNQLEIDKRRL